MIRSEYLPFGRPNFSEEEIEAVSRIMRSGWVGMGSETIAFEEELAQFAGAKHVVTVSSCTAALFLALLVKGIGPGDEVICPSLTWCSTANVALHLGAKAVFCDVDPKSLCITRETVLPKITSRTKAVMAVHLAGYAIDITELRRALPPTVAIIEDAAHALGAIHDDGKTVGSSGNLVCYSFYANKNLSTGEGGAIALDDDDLAMRLRALRQHGLNVDAWKRFTHPKTMLMSPLTTLGYKMNYTDLQACIGRVQLRRQGEFHERRLAIASLYYDKLSPRRPALRFQAKCLDKGHARHLFLAELPGGKMKRSRDEVLRELRSRNVGATVHYAPLHKMPLYAESQHDTSRLPVTEAVCENILTLPISASMTLDDAAYVIEQFSEVAI